MLSDKLTAGEAEVFAAYDYYPFGMMARKIESSNSYRFGYNGMEKDDEIYGAGNSYTAEFWQYDSRLARRWNIDPVIISSESPYATFRNNPIFYNDPNGDCADCPKPEGKGDKEGATKTTSYSSKYMDIRDGMDRTITMSKEWYWHAGSKQGEVTFQAGWYDVSAYKEILTGTTDNAERSISLNIRALTQDVIGSKSIITEKDLSVAELLALNKVVERTQKAGKSNIEYKDYATSGDDPYADVAGNSAKKDYGSTTSDLWKKKNDPTYALKTTLGQASIVVENGHTYVVDTYDFNDAAAAQEGKSVFTIFKDYLVGVKDAGLNPYKQARNLGTYYGSKDGEGIPIKIKIR